MGGKFVFNFVDLGGGNFEMETTLRSPGETDVLCATDPMTRYEAEELMHQMVFVLGYKLAN